MSLTRFILLADAEPGLLPRVVAPFARRHLMPDQVTARRQGDLMYIEIALTGAPVPELRLAAGNLRQIVGFRQLTVEGTAA